MPQQEIQQQLEYENERTAQQAAAENAASSARRQVEKRLENPEFFQQLRDPDVDSDEYDWLEKDLGPIFSGAHIIGQRSEQYEREAKWTNMARAERVIQEGDPGRLCKGPLLEMAQRVRGRQDKDVTPEYTRDEKRAVRDAMDASTALKTLAIESKGLDSVTQATAVHKTEKNESENKSTKERAASIFN